LVDRRLREGSRNWSERTEIRALQLVGWIGLSRSKFYSWRNRYGKANEHNTLVPRDHWLEPWEKVAIISFHHQFPLEGYRRLTSKAASLPDFQNGNDMGVGFATRVFAVGRKLR
jgi:hypothetical protein